MSYPMRIAQRIVISLLLGLFVGFVISEVSFQILKESNRAPETVELVIPEGTAEQIAKGQPAADIPSEMTFVVGDILLVTNKDTTDHQLGPLWIPAGSSASLNLDENENYIFACSFQTSNFFGLDVREAVTLGTKIGGIIFAGVPLGAILALYSFISWPVKKENPE